MDPSITSTVGWLVASVVVGMMGGAIGALVVLWRRSNPDPGGDLDRHWPNKT